MVRGHPAGVSSIWTKAAPEGMIAEVFPEAYDVEGRKVLRPDLKRKGLHPTFPMGRYVSQPLTVTCKSIAEIRRFLCACKYVADKEQFGKRDYWQAPEEFEKIRKGDCDCFAIWTWRQLLALGYDARFVAGKGGRYGEGHAWVQFSKDGKCFLVEPTLAILGSALPRLRTLRYQPKFSVAWDGASISFYQHNRQKSYPSFLMTITCIPAWLIFWFWIWTKTLMLLPLWLYRRVTAAHKKVRE